MCPLLSSDNTQGKYLTDPPSVLIEEGAEVPEKYLVPQDPKIDKKAILADLKAGSSYDRIRLVQTESLRIR